MLLNRSIKLDSLALKLILDRIKRKGKSLETSTSTIPKVNVCRGIKVSEYEAKIKEISQLLDLYKELLSMDLADADTTRRDIAKVDSTIAKKFMHILK